MTLTPYEIKLILKALNGRLTKKEKEDLFSVKLWMESYTTGRKCSRTGKWIKQL